jgi:hypothetical protein
MTISRIILLIMRNVSDQSRRGNKDTHFMLNTISPIIAPFVRQCGKMWKSWRGHRWHCHTTHAHCMLDDKVYWPSLRICNIYCFFTATTVMRTRLNVMLDVHLLSCSLVITKNFLGSETGLFLYLSIEALMTVALWYVPPRVLMTDRQTDRDRQTARLTLHVEGSLRSYQCGFQCNISSDVSVFRVITPDSSVRAYRSFGRTHRSFGRTYYLQLKRHPAAAGCSENLANPSLTSKLP